MLRKNTRPVLNLLELVPHHNRAFDVDAEGLVTVSVPRFKHDWMMRHLVPRGKHPHIRTRLDAFGSFVWLQIDGTRTVGEIGHALEERFGEEVRPVHERLGAFVRSIRDRTFIVLRRADGTPV